ncbi:MAG: hypothetical protein K6A05_07900 [Lachnospiraceae bacterium]|nr:hypothetical protein [Lachnospiraceae bacterium]
MRKEYKTAIALLKYAPKLKLQIVMAVVFLAIGLFYDLLMRGQSAVGALYFILPTSFLLQAFYATNLSGMIQTSSVRKKTHTLYPYIFTIPYVIIAYLLAAGFHAYLAVHGNLVVSYASNYAIQSRYMLFAGILFMVTIIYLAVGNKFFWSGLTLFVVGVLPPMIISQSRYTPRIFAFCEASMLRCFVLGLVFTIVGCAVSYLLSVVFYKKDIAPIAMKQMARTYLK